MATYRFKCSACHRPISARSKYYKRYLAKYFCINESELSQRYICKKCQMLSKGEKDQRKLSLSQIKIENYLKYQQLRSLIHKEILKVERLGRTPEAIKNFNETVKYALDEEGILRYTYIVEDNKLKGILMQIPFLGKIKMMFDLSKGEDYYD